MRYRCAPALLITKSTAAACRMAAFNSTESHAASRPTTNRKPFNHDSITGNSPMASSAQQQRPPIQVSPLPRQIGIAYATKRLIELAKLDGWARLYHACTVADSKHQPGQEAV